MIPVVLSIGVALALLFASFTAQLGRLSAARARAQLTADAVALGAVAESTPYGEGRHQAVAQQLAAANGARLVSCTCAPGTTSVQVRVTAEGVVADARAVFDPGALAPARVASDVSGLHPALARAVERLIAESRGRVRLVSGFRSTRRQAELWTNALRKYRSPEVADDWVAPPGRSMHERGLAVDLGGDLQLAARLVSELGLPLHRPLPNEPWHYELIGTRGPGARA